MMKTVSVELQPCLGNRSGIGTYAYELGRRLRDTGEIRYQGNVFNFLGRRDNSAELAGITMDIREQHAIPYSGFRFMQHAVPVPYSMLFGRSDLNLFFNYIVPAGTGGKVITTIHDMAYIRCPETLRRRNLLRLRSGMKDTLKRADRILTISGFSKKEITELLDVPPERIEVIGCAAPDMAEPAPFAGVSRKFGIDTPYILFVGTIEPRKNLSRLLEAFDCFRDRYGTDHSLVLAGGKGWRNEEIFGTLGSLKHREDVIVTGFVSPEEKAALYGNAELLCFPSLYEGFGIPPLEAMRYGCPVVCSDRASLPEIAGDAARYVRADDVEDIAEGMWKVIGDAEERRMLIEKGFARPERFSWDRSAEKLKKVCKEVLDE